MKSFSTKEALVVGWQTFKERPFFLIGLFILTTVISSVMGLVAENVSGSTGVVINLVDFAIQIILGMGITLILLRVYDKSETDYTDLVEPLHLFWKYLVMTILVVSIITIGLVLFLVPGIVAGIALAFAPYLVVDRNMGPVQAIKESMRITHGHRWGLFIFGFLIFVINILGAIVFGMGLFLTIPITALAAVHVYRWLLNPPEHDGSEVTMTAKVLVSFAFVLVLGGLIVFVLALGGIRGSETADMRDAQRQADMGVIGLAADMYYTEYGTFPTTLQDMVPDLLNDIPRDPATNTEYVYTTYGENIDYQLCAELESTGQTYCTYGLEVGGE